MAERSGMADAPMEAVVVAGLLGCAPEELTGIGFLIFSTQRDRPPDLPGYARSEGRTGFMRSADRHAGYPQGFVRYDSPDGALVAVPHEYGWEIWTVIDHAKDLVELAGGILGLIAFFKTQRGADRLVRRRRYTRAGDVKEGAERPLKYTGEGDKHGLAAELAAGARDDPAPPAAGE